MIQRATKHTPISASIEFINEQAEPEIQHVEFLSA